jgi:2,4-dienoyl-CoA reductase-like NADH-dependent reductase (Old Yellow Enzyme family)
MMGMNFAKPHPASQGEIDHVIDGFAHAAEFLDKAGYDGIQLHAAHGYLLSQFLSRVTNKRTDQYGGCLENRLRIIVEVAEECRKRVSEDFILAIKINSVEFQEDGITPEEAQSLCITLEQTRFDYVELSGGTYETQAFIHKRESTKKRESFFLEFAEEIVKPLSRTKTYITGGFKTAGAMVNALETVDGVGLARVAAQEFHLPRDIVDGKVTGAIQSKLDENNYGLTNVAAGTQIQQVGKDEMPFDLSDEKSLQAFMGDMYAWGKKLGADREYKLSGYVDLTSPSTPFV